MRETSFRRVNMLYLYVTLAFVKYCALKNSSQLPEFRPNIHIIELYIVTIVLEFIKFINLYCISVGTFVCIIITLHPSPQKKRLHAGKYLKHRERDISMEVGDSQTYEQYYLKTFCYCENMTVRCVFFSILTIVDSLYFYVQYAMCI